MLITSFFIKQCVCVNPKLPIYPSSLLSPCLEMRYDLRGTRAASRGEGEYVIGFGVKVFTLPLGEVLGSSGGGE